MTPDDVFHSAVRFSSAFFSLRLFSLAPESRLRTFGKHRVHAVLRRGTHSSLFLAVADAPLPIRRPRVQGHSYGGCAARPQNFASAGRIASPVIGSEKVSSVRRYNPTDLVNRHSPYRSIPPPVIFERQCRIESSAWHAG